MGARLADPLPAGYLEVAQLGFGGGSVGPCIDDKLCWSLGGDGKLPGRGHPSPLLTSDALMLSELCTQRLRELASEDSTKPVLRISINAGGCSGFQYNFDLVEGPEADDRCFFFFTSSFIPPSA